MLPESTLQASEKITQAEIKKIFELLDTAAALKILWPGVLQPINMKGLYRVENLDLVFAAGYMGSMLEENSRLSRFGTSSKVVESPEFFRAVADIRAEVSKLQELVNEATAKPQG